MPSVPPEAVRVVVNPLQMVVVPVMEDGAVEGVFTVTGTAVRVAEGQEGARVHVNTTCPLPVLPMLLLWFVPPLYDPPP